jgi:hypothetical protein
MKYCIVLLLAVAVSLASLKETASQAVPPDTELNDEEKAAFDVLQPTIRIWLRGGRIRNKFTEASNESIREIVGKDKTELSESETTWFANFRYEPKLVDVDGDGRPELAIRNSCAAVGNCQFWIFSRKKKRGGYATILKTPSGAVQTFKLKGSKTNGYFDVETKSHGDAWSGSIEVYKFNGAEYELRECFSYAYSYLRNGKRYYMKRPAIKRLKCS